MRKKENNVTVVHNIENNAKIYLDLERALKFFECCIKLEILNIAKKNRGHAIDVVLRQNL